MARIISKSERKTLGEPLGDDLDARLGRLVANGRNFQLALSRNRNRIVALAVAMAEQYVRRSIDLSPEILDGIYAASLKAACAPEGVVRVHPEAGRFAELQELAAASGFQVVVDSSLSTIGCVVTSGRVEIDSQLQTAMAIFKKALN